MTPEIPSPAMRPEPLPKLFLNAESPRVSIPLLVSFILLPGPGGALSQDAARSFYGAMSLPLHSEQGNYPIVIARERFLVENP